jgi:hypothetical protein
MHNLSNAVLASALEIESKQKKFEAAWNLYLALRNETVPTCDEIDRGRSSGAIKVDSYDTTFSLLREAKTVAREALQTHLSENIEVEFVLALMQSTANTTTRFMLAKPTEASYFRSLALMILWKGLCAVDPQTSEL